jgi:hypothetical protein
MDFRQRKLPKEAAINLRISPIASVKPYALMIAPVYVFMRLNEKFVSVKAPLDFFTPEELERLQPFESFFLPEFVDAALPFRQVARNVKRLVGWQPKLAGPGAGGELPPAPYEISDAVLRMLGPLLGAGCVIEPFFAAVFANELCELMPPERLRQARDQDVAAYERAVLRSGWAVFLALLLGYCDLPFLNGLQRRVFEASFTGVGIPAVGRAADVDELLEIVWASMGPGAAEPVRGEVFGAHPSRSAQKVAHRLRRVQDEAMISETEPVPTIFGPRGFADG